MDSKVAINKNNLILIAVVILVVALGIFGYLYLTNQSKEIDEQLARQRENEVRAAEALRAASELDVVNPLDKVVPEIDPTDSVNPFKQNSDQYENPFE